MEANQRRTEVGRVTYSKLERGEPIDVTAVFFSDGSYEFASQDRWEVRSHSFTPTEQELNYARMLAERKVTTCQRFGFNATLDQSLAFEFVASPDELNRPISQLRKVAKYIQFEAPINPAQLQRLGCLLADGDRFLELWCRLKCEIQKWRQRVRLFIKAESEGSDNQLSSRVESATILSAAAASIRHSVLASK